MTADAEVARLLSGMPVVVLNLDRRPDRWSDVLDAFPSINDQMVRYPAIDGASLAARDVAAFRATALLDSDRKNACGRLGVLRSCRDLMDTIMSVPVAIFEDDAIPTGIPAAPVPNNADLLILGGRPVDPFIPNGRGWVPVTRWVNKQAFVIQTEQALIALREAWSGEWGPSDVQWWYALQRVNAYVASPAMVTQQDGWSDIEARYRTDEGGIRRDGSTVRFRHRASWSERLEHA